MMSPSSRTRTELFQALRFGLVGALATLTHIGVAMVVLALGANPFTSNLAGFAAAFVLGLAGHLRFTFCGSIPLPRAAWRYGTIAIAGFFANNVVLLTLGNLGVISDAAALAISISIVPAGTFLASRFWGFVSDD